ncbi:MAG: hypothetical protein KDK78_07650, partial [Chlamydiia bacterium]|nr:hypothetical protein [Chlamydiia bacterium]
MNPQERFDRFISLFSEGRYLSALQHLFHRPHVPLESYGAHERYLRPILNFADALAYESPHDAFVLAKQLQIDLDAEPRFLLDDSAFLDRIQGLLPLLACASGAVPVEKGRRAYDELDPEDLYFFDAVTSNTPNASEAGQLVRHRHHLLCFREAYPELSQALDFAYIPLFPLRFDPPSKPSYHIPLSEGVCIWAEPYAIDWSALRRDVGSRPTILAFQNKAALVHCLQFPEVLDWLRDPQTWPWVLNAYLYDHGSTLPPACSYSSITVSQNHWIVENSELLLAQLCSAVRSFHPLEKEDSAEADLLYDSGKRLAFVSESERLGQCRHLAHWMREAQRDFFDDPHTRRPAKPALLNTPLPDHLGQVLSAAHPLFPKRPKHKRERYRVAHLFRILLDTSHAPTKILRTLLSRLDKDCFEQSLYTLENGLLRPREYPLHTVTAKISEETGPRTLALAAEHGVHCRSFANQQDDYNDLSARVCQALHEDEIDLVIHHYTPSVALLINRRSDCPCEIVFNHGGPDILPDPSGFALPAYNALPTHPGFDLIIESEKRTTEALAFYDSIGSHVVNLGFVIDHNLEQTEKPVERSCL